MDDKKINEILNELPDVFLKTSQYSLCSTYFETLPEGWVNNGFTVDRGLHSPKTGGIDVTAYWDVYSVLDAHTVRARIKIKDVQSSFALFKKYSVHGGIAAVDCKERRLNLYKPWDGRELPEIVISENMTIPVIAGREYLVCYEKILGSIHRLTITDTVTGQSDQVSYLNSSHPYDDYAGKQWGAPGVMFLNGDITVRKFEYISTAPKDCKAMIYGDSITEGYGMDNNRAFYEDRWSAKIRRALNGNCAICGRGAGDSSDMLLRMEFELARFTPKYVVMMIGTNDTDISVWKENIDTAIRKVESIGAIPVLCVPPTGRELVGEMGVYLRSRNYSVVGMDYATSINNDGVTQDLTLFSDTTHPNTAGNLKMYNQFLIDAPEVFE